MFPNPATALAHSVIDELARGGVVHVVAAPGSRSTALVLAASAHPVVSLHMEVDERSAGFFALGIGKQSGMPAAVLTTSGTAVANLLPAIVEADYSASPLIAISADRPPELRNTGANQTIDQLHIFRQVRWFAELGVAEDLPLAARYWRSTVSRAVAEARGWSGSAGPVHLNAAFREPTVPESDDGRSAAAPFRSEPVARPDNLPWVAVPQRMVAASESVVTDLVARIKTARRGVVVLGAGRYDSQPMVALAGRLGWPVIAAPWSGTRGGEAAVSTAHHLLALPEFAGRHHADLILRVGTAGLSPQVASFLAGADQHVLIEPGAAWSDPDRSMDLAVAADPGDLGRRLNAAVDPREPWGEWRVAERLARAAIDGVLDGMDEPTEPRTARDVAATADLLVIGSSMPVRDLDWFMAPRDGLSVIGNRGASGIDGFVSTALGVALAAGGAVALCGDLSLLHDQNGFFVNVQGSLNCVFVVVNNDGGGIFSFLAQSRQPGFERLFATPHGREFEQLAAFHRLGYQRIGRAVELIPAIQAARQSGGVHLLEVPGDRAANVLVHRRIAAAVRAAIPPS